MAYKKKNYSQDRNENSYQDREQKKHSGAKKVFMKAGQHQGEACLVAWNYSKGKGMVKVLITPYGKTHESTSKNGRTWLNMFCKIFYVNTGVEIKTSVMVDANSYKGTVKELGWIVNPNAPNGGYCGTFTKS